MVPWRPTRKLLFLDPLSPNISYCQAALESSGMSNRLSIDAFDLCGIVPGCLLSKLMPSVTSVLRYIFEYGKLEYGKLEGDD